MLSPLLVHRALRYIVVALVALVLHASPYFLTLFLTPSLCSYAKYFMPPFFQICAAI